MIISDAGSQLRATDQEMKDWRKGWSQEELVWFGFTRGLEWHFVIPGAQHQNSATEILVKLSKGVIKSLR